MIVQIYNNPHFDFMGLHAHIGSQIHQTEPFFENVRSLLRVYKKLKEENIHFDSVNIGGGFGVYYTKEDEPIILETFLNSTAYSLFFITTSAYIKSINLYLFLYVNIEPIRNKLILIIQNIIVVVKLILKPLLANKLTLYPSTK